MQHASATLRKIFRQTVCHQGDSAAVLAWPLACGAKTAERTNAINFAAGVLTVSVPDEAWRRQLQSFSSRYLAALNQVTSEPVSRIDFVTVKNAER
ncbi:MAG: DciA family protein [Candidatus Korobacteraceae bacterium]